MTLRYDSEDRLRTAVLRYLASVGGWDDSLAVARQHTVNAIARESGVARSDVKRILEDLRSEGLVDVAKDVRKLQNEMWWPTPRGREMVR